MRIMVLSTGVDLECIPPPPPSVGLLGSWHGMGVRLFRGIIISYDKVACILDYDEIIITQSSRGNFPNTAHLGNTAHLAISAPGDRREISDTWETYSLILGIL